METAYCKRCGKRQITAANKYCNLCLQANRIYRAKKKSEFPVGSCTLCGKQRDAGYKRCIVCRTSTGKSVQLWRDRNPRDTAKYQREFNRSRRLRVIQHYGGKCVCCGESEIDFLAIDHTNGGGDKHRLEVGSGARMVGWIISQNFPEGFRILCHNCNQAIGYYGSCPHEKQRKPQLRLVANE